MATPNTKNAHVRKPSPKRDDMDTKANDAQRLLDDPAFQKAYAAVEEGLHNAIRELRHDGQPATDAFERELCRTLRTLSSVKRAIVLAVQKQKLSLVDFQSTSEH